MSDRPRGRGSEVHRSGLWTVLPVLALMVACFAAPFAEAAASSEDLFVLSRKDLAGDSQMIVLPTQWRFRAEDDPSFARTEVDHGSWRQVDTLLRLGEVPEDWTGVGWFRLRFRVDSSLSGMPLSLQLRQLGAAEVYLDGEQLLSVGTIGATAEETERGIQREPLVFSFDERRVHVFAVRYCNHAPEEIAPISEFGGFQLAIAEANRRVMEHVRTVQSLSAYQAFFTGVFVSFALLHMLLFVFYPEADENLYFALLTATVALLVYLFLQGSFATDPGFFHLFDRGVNLARLALSLFALRFVYSVFHEAMPRQFYLVLVAALVLAVPGWLAPLGASRWVFVFVLLASVEMVRTVVVAIARNKPGSRLVGVGILTLAAGMAVGLFATLGLLPSSIVTTVLIPFSCVVFLMVTMSIYLSRRFAQANRELRQQLEQIRKLSTQQLEQERRTREEEVKRARIEAEYEQKVAELEEARRLQLSMLPDDLPDVPDVELAATMQTATEVGGDYYDFRVDEDGTLTIAIGDATGHGMKAGTMVTATKSLFNALGSDEDLSETLVRFTRALKRMNFHRLRMALTLARYRSGRLVLAAAGMPPALVYRAATGMVESISINGMPLGSYAGFPYQQSELSLQPGDTVLLMSDGFPERLNRDAEMLGFDKAAEAFSQVARTAPQDIIERLTASSEAWAEGRPPADDTTFVVLKVRDDSSLTQAHPA